MNRLSFCGHFICLALITFLPIQLWGSQHIFSQFTIESGLPKNTIDCIVQGYDGKLYLGTPNGLGVFNGHTFTNYNQDNNSGFSSSIWELLPLNEDLVLIGTLDKGLYILDNRHETLVHLRLSTNPGSYTPKVYSLFDDDQYIWVGCTDGVVIKILKNDLLAYEEEDILEVNKYEINTPTVIHSITKYKNTLLVSTDMPIVYGYNRNIDEFSLAYDFTNKCSQVLDICTKGDSILFGTDNGIFIGQYDPIDENQNNYQHLLRGKVISALAHDGNHIWTGTRSSGLYKISYLKGDINYEHFEYKPLKKNSINSNSIISLCIDNQRNLWIGTWNGGLNKTGLNTPRFSHVYDRENEIDIQLNTIWCIEENGNDKYFLGTYSNGLNLYDPDENSFHAISKNSNLSSITNLLLLKDKKELIVGTWGNGIKIIDPVTYREKLMKSKKYAILDTDRIYALYQDEREDIWIGSYKNGLYKYLIQEGKLQKIRLNADNQNKTDVRHIFAEPEKNAIWISSYHSGTFRLTYDQDGIITENIRIRFKEESRKMLNIFSITKMDDRLYCTTNDGIFVLDTNNEWSRFLPALKGKICTQMLSDKYGNIWIATYTGLFKFVQKTEKLINFFKYSECRNMLYDHQENRMIVCTNEGLIVFRPEKNPLKSKQPKILFSNFKVFDELVTSNEVFQGIKILNANIDYIESLVLPYFANSFSIDLDILDMSEYKNIEISYRLKGLHNRWNHREDLSLTANYTNVPSGNYELEVQVTSLQHEWEPITRVLSITKLSPWWLTTWAYTCYVLLIIIILWLIIYDINKRVKIKNELKLEKIKLEQGQAMNVQKLSFFTNISHDLKTPLSLILSPVEQMITQSTSDETLHNQLKMIQRNALNLMRMLNQILDFRRVEGTVYHLNHHKVELGMFINEAISQFLETAKNKHIEMEVDLPASEIWMAADPDKFESIIFNLLSNSIKYTKKYGQIHVRLFRENNQIILEIEDSGIGIEKEELPHIFERFYRTNLPHNQRGTGIGLAIIKKYTELHGGHINVSSQIGKGTIFTLTFTDKHEENIGDLPVFALYQKESSEIIDLAHDNMKLDQSILIIEDNADMRAHLSHLFQADFQIYTADDGEMGISLAKQKDPSIIISDVMMGEVDGFEVCQHIKSNLNTSHIPVILLTAKGGESARIEGIDKGADAFIEKPFNTKLLTTTVAKLIGQRQALRKKFAVMNIKTEVGVPVSIDEKFMVDIHELIESKITDAQFSIQYLADEMNISHDQLYRKIKILTGMSINHFIRTIRLKHAAQLLITGNYHISEIVYMVGFNSPSYFTKCFKSEFGELPKAYQENYQQEN